jgi:predicted PurR-regulated permease PerM
MRFVKAFFQFWYDFIIGDDWKIAAAVVIVLVAGAIAVLAGVPGAVLAPVLALAFGAAFAAALLIDTDPRQRD